MTNLAKFPLRFQKIHSSVIWLLLSALLYFIAFYNPPIYPNQPESRCYYFSGGQLPGGLDHFEQATVRLHDQGEQLNGEAFFTATYTNKEGEKWCLQLGPRSIPLVDRRTVSETKPFADYQCLTFNHLQPAQIRLFGQGLSCRPKHSAPLSCTAPGIELLFRPSSEIEMSKNEKSDAQERLFDQAELKLMASVESTAELLIFHFRQLALYLIYPWATVSDGGLLLGSDRDASKKPRPGYPIPCEVIE